MKNKFAKIFSFILICCISFLCVGCMGSNPEDYEDDDWGSEWEDGDNDFSDDMVVDLYGTRVLYRPDSYNYNSGSGAIEGETNDYYGKYAHLILNTLYENYGIVNNRKVESTIGSGIETSFLYDNIRYNVNTAGVVSQEKIQGETTTTPLGESEYFVGANLDVNWNWSFDYQLYNSTYNVVLLTNDEYDLIDNNKIYTNYASFDEFKQFITEKYVGSSTMASFYQTTMLGTADKNDYSNYSDYVKTLEYVVYSYALDLEPNAVTININDNVSSESDNLYTVNISGFENVDKALEHIKTLFTKIGSYVGLIDRQINKISAWIKNNVIGEDALNNDSFTTYSNITKIVDASGNIVGYELGEGSTTTLKNYNTAVNNIVQAVCSEVSIGSDEGGEDVTIDNRFLASEVCEYAGETFMIFDDSNFPAPGTPQASYKTSIKPLEYQSVQLMPRTPIEVSEIWVALKYDADLDGTEEGVYNPDKYLDIIVEVNYYNHSQNTFSTLASQKTRVHDGGYVFGEDQTINGQKIENHGMACLEFDKITIGAFNPDIGGGILKTDVGQNGYTGNPIVSQDPRVLVGTTNVRKYYSIIEPTDTELGNNQTYVTGRSNEKMYAGSDGCDYLEITYKVLKTKGDTTTNYKFYTGLAGVFDW